jgi:hypothetical protein
MADRRPGSLPVCGMTGSGHQLKSDTTSTTLFIPAQLFIFIKLFKNVSLCVFKNMPLIISCGISISVKKFLSSDLGIDTLMLSKIFFNLFFVKSIAQSSIYCFLMSEFTSRSLGPSKTIRWL